jgi:CheY-like chemotaxis protein
MQLPEFDGLCFLDQYRELYEMNPALENTKVVILSAYIDKYPDHLWSSYSFVAGKVNKPLSDKVLGGLQDNLPKVA